MSSYVVPATLNAKDPRYGLTLDELAEWVAVAKRDGVDGDAPLRVTVNMTGGAKTVTVLTGPELEKRRARRDRSQ